MKLTKHLINCNQTPSLEAEEEENLDQYIAEDREAKVACNRKTAQHVQTAILWDSYQVLSAEATLPENATKDLILQVILCNHFIVITYL